MINIKQLPREVLIQIFYHLFTRPKPDDYYDRPENDEEDLTREFPHLFVEYRRSPHHHILMTCQSMYKMGIKEYNANSTRIFEFESRFHPHEDDFIRILTQGHDRLAVEDRDVLFMLNYLYQRGHKIERVDWNSHYTFTIEDRTEIIEPVSFIRAVLRTEPAFVVEATHLAEYIRNIPHVEFNFKVIRTKALCLEENQFHEVHATFTMRIKPGEDDYDVESIRAVHDERFKHHSRANGARTLDCDCHSTLSAKMNVKTQTDALELVVKVKEGLV